MGGQAFSLSITSGIVLICLYAAYRTMMRSTTHFNFNRGAIIIIYIAAFAAPCIKFDDAISSIVAESPVVTGNNEMLATTAAYTIGQSAFTTMLVKIYVAGTVATAAWFAANIIYIILLLFNSRKTVICGHMVHIHRHSSVSPFSWGGQIFIPENFISSGDKNLAMVIAHEAAHTVNRHWLDLLLSNFAIVINWYNPAAWLLQRELINVHEFEADHHVINHTGDPVAYQLLLIEKTAGCRFQALADSLNHSSLKKRITMMMKNQSKGSARLRALALLPALTAALCLTNSSCINDAKEQVSAEPVAESMEAVSENTTVLLQSAPQFPDGIEQFYRMLYENIAYPQSAIDDSISGKVIVEITIDTNGSIKNPKILHGIRQDLDNSAIDAINNLAKSMKEQDLKWTPAIDKDGNVVNTTYVIPVLFKLQ